MAAAAPSADYALQHLIDPEVCIRCNTCESTCPIGAITHDSRNYVVDFATCNGCNACVAAMPDGRDRSLAPGAQGGAVHARRSARVGHLAGAGRARRRGGAGDVPEDVRRLTRSRRRSGRRGVAPWSAAHPYVNLYSREAGDRDGRRQLSPDRPGRIGRYPPHRARFRQHGVPRARGPDARHSAARASTRTGKPHHVRLYSVASPRDGERPQHNNVALTIKRVTRRHDGQPVQGIGSNYLCDLRSAMK